MVREEGLRFIQGVALASFGFGEAEIEAVVDGFAVTQEPVFLGFEEVEGAGDDFGGVVEVAPVEFTLDALFGAGVEGGGSWGEYTTGWGACEIPHILRIEIWAPGTWRIGRGGGGSRWRW